METKQGSRMRDLLGCLPSNISGTLLAMFDKMVAQKMRYHGGTVESAYALFDRLLGDEPKPGDRLGSVACLGLNIDNSGSLKDPALGEKGDTKLVFADKPKYLAVIAGLNAVTVECKRNLTSGYGTDVLFHLMHRRPAYVSAHLNRSVGDGKFPWLPATALPEFTTRGFNPDGSTPLYTHHILVVLLTCARAQWHVETCSRSVNRAVLSFTDGRPEADADEEWFTAGDVKELSRVVSPEKNPLVRQTLLGLLGADGVDYKKYATACGIKDVLPATNADMAVSALKLWSRSRSSSQAISRPATAGAALGGLVAAVRPEDLPLAEEIPNETNAATDGTATVFGFNLDDDDTRNVELLMAEPIDEMVPLVPAPPANQTSPVPNNGTPTS